MSTFLSGYEFEFRGVTFTVDLALDTSTLAVDSLSIEEMCWYWNKQGHQIAMPTGTDLRLLKDALVEELNGYCRGEIQQIYMDQLKERKP